jgi:hypothetical protein
LPIVVNVWVRCWTSIWKWIWCQLYECPGLLLVVHGKGPGRHKRRERCVIKQIIFIDGFKLNQLIGPYSHSWFQFMVQNCQSHFIVYFGVWHKQ